MTTTPSDFGSEPQGELDHSRCHYLIITAISAVLFMFLMSCMTLPNPEIPPRDAPGSSAESEESFENFKLSVEKKPLGFVVLQGQELQLSSYSQLDPLFLDTSIAAHHYYLKARRRNRTGLWLSGAGGALIGTVLGVVTVEGSRFIGVDYALIGAGAGLVISGIVVSGTQLGPMQIAVDEYNNELKYRWV